LRTERPKLTEAYIADKKGGESSLAGALEIRGFTQESLGVRMDADACEEIPSILSFRKHDGKSGTRGQLNNIFATGETVPGDRIRLSPVEA